MEPLTILITTYNRLEYFKRTIESLFATTPQNTKFVIWDNASTEAGLIDYIKDLGVSSGRDVTGMLSPENLGWGAAVNRAIFALKELGELKNGYILIANDDVDNWDTDWLDKSYALYQKYPQIGLLAMWSHINHGMLEDHGDLIVKDQMPAVAWMIKVDRLLKFPEHGPSPSKGGNGEDSLYCVNVAKEGWWVAAPKQDFATHITWY